MRNSVFYFLLACIVCFCSTARAQEVISSAGNHFTNNKIKISWTLGEPVVPTLSNENIQLTQGFHQAKLTITAVNEIPKLTMHISAYPNPACDFLKLSIKNNLKQDLHYTLYTFDGKMLLKKQIESDLSEIPMTMYVSAVYFLKVSDNQSILKTFKIVKQ